MSFIHRATTSVRCRVSLFALALLVPMTLITGCGKDGASSSSVTSDGVVATVNGVNITKDQMYFEMEQYIPAQLPGFPSNPMLGMSAGRVELQQLIQNELVVQYAKSENVPVTDKDVDLRYQDTKTFKDLLMTRPFEDMLKDQDVTVDEYKQENVAPIVAQFNLATKGLTETDAELHAYYNANISDYTDPQSVHLERIILDDEGSAEQAYQIASKANSLDSVMNLNRAIALTGGKNDADLVAWFTTNQPVSQLTAVISEAADSKPGTILKPIEINNKWWLVQVVDVRPKSILPYDTVQHIVYWNVLQNKANLAGNFQKTVSGLHDFIQTAVITVPTQYSSIPKQLKNPVGQSASLPGDAPSN